jgi:hypothetical protein
VTFQTSGSSQSASLGTLDKGGDHLVSDTDPGKTREGLFKREAVLFGVMAGASVFDKHEAKAETGALARSGLDACVGRDTGENNGIDSTGLELVFQVAPRFRKRVRAVSYTVSFILVRKIRAEISINAATLTVENEAYPC